MRKWTDLGTFSRSTERRFFESVAMVGVCKERGAQINHTIKRQSQKCALRGLRGIVNINAIRIVIIFSIIIPMPPRF